ncbi:MAG: hypothetical protein DHS20C15_00370 [Planctomycetota bacterium]|nr:MAG: hypothetical protein DHS20C15_00370 [Planctomycetota bacterium]
MTPPDDSNSSAQPTPAEASNTAPDASNDPANAGDGRWVWQYGAPPPPPSFGARLFAGNASPEFLRFAFCALLVVIGCLLPWGPQAVELTGELAGDAGAALTDAADTSYVVPPTIRGVDLPLGALSLMLGIWLLYASMAGAYSGRHRILPVVLMIEPALVTLGLLGDAMTAAGDEGFLRALDLAGTGVLLTFVGSALMALQFIFLLGKVFAKKDDKAPARRSKDAKGGKGKADAKSGKAGKGRSKSKGKGDDKAKPADAPEKSGDGEAGATAAGASS